MQKIIIEMNVNETNEKASICIYIGAATHDVIALKNILKYMYTD